MEVTDIELAHAEHRHVLAEQVSRFQRTFKRADRDELLARANLEFCESFAGWKPERGSFGPRLNFNVWHALLDDLSHERKRALPEQNEGLDEHPERTAFDLDIFLAEVGRDAAVVIRLALSGEGKTNQHRRQNILHRLRERGWSGGRIARAFNEIKESLNIT